MTMPRVFIPQVVERFDHVANRFVPVFDLTEAATFGSLTTILDKNDDPMFLAQVTDKIRDALATFGENDYFVAIGDPSVVAICAAIILRRQSTIKMLKWDKKLSRYLTLELKP